MSLEDNTSRVFSSRSLNPPSRFLSRFSFNPGNLSFRLTRGNSLDSARSCPASSTGFIVSNDEEEYAGASSSSRNRNGRMQGCDFFPACFTNRSPRTEDASNSIPDFSVNFQDNNGQLDSGNDVLRNINSTNLFSPINQIDPDGAGTRHSRRRIAGREPAERNVRFSRTLSVGRLRDRVLRRNPASDLDLDDFQQDREEVRLTRHFSVREDLGHEDVGAMSDNNNLTQQVSTNNVPSSFSTPFYGSQDNVYGPTRSRETRYRDLLEHRSNFIERRRRIRSQVCLFSSLTSSTNILSSLYFQ